MTETNHPCADGYASWDETKVTKVSGCNGGSDGHCTADGKWMCKGLAEIHDYGSPFAACSDALLGEGLSEKENTQFLSECCEPGKGVCGDFDGAAVAGTALVLATLALAAML